MAKLKHKDWDAYYKQMSLSPRKHVLRALKYFEQHPPRNKVAIDLGCGNGRDTLALLEQGWEVLAIDKAPKAVELLWDNIPEDYQRNLKIEGKSFEEANWRKTHLVNACASLPFCELEHFEKVWYQVEQAIEVDGIFTGNFFGVNDSWRGRVVCLSKVQVELMFADFEMIEFEEKEFDKTSARGPMKHWHTFDILAKKIT